MAKMIYFDVCALAIMVVLVIALLARKLTKGKVNRYFMLMLLVALVASGADIVAVALDNLGAGHIVGKYVSHTLYLLFHNMTTPMIITYVVALTDTWHKIEEHRFLETLLPLPIYVVAIGLVINFFTPAIFYFDESDSYTRGSWFFILYVSAVLYILVGAYFVIRYYKLFTMQQFIAIGAIFPLMVSAIVVQMFFPSLLVEMFANSIGFLGMALVIQRPEERMDAATGFGNMDAYTNDMKKSFTNRKEFDLILLSIVNYQTIWDMMGYENAKGLLLSIAVQFEELFRAEHVRVELYNLGQGQYAAAIARKDGKKTAEFAEKISNGMRISVPFEEMEVNLVSNTCVVHCPQDLHDVPALLALEEDLRRNARSGDVLLASNLFQPDKFDMMKNIDRVLERAIAEHKFEIYYQPIYSVADKRFKSAEALLRLKDDEYGFISPEIFIPAAEKSGAIHRIGTYVLEEVCRFVGSSEFEELGMDYIEINLSVQQCMQKNLAQDVLKIMEKYQVPANRINLEITETAASYAQNIFLKNLTTLEKAGIKFSLDDYGTGYSNMQRIVSLPLHMVKLDKDFISAGKDVRMQIVLQNTVRMIKDMEMEIVVEGIETQEMVDFFSELECEYIQGYFYSKPIPKDAFIEFIREHKKELQ